MKVTNIVSSRL